MASWLHSEVAFFPTNITSRRLCSKTQWYPIGWSWSTIVCCWNLQAVGEHDYWSGNENNKLQRKDFLFYKYSQYHVVSYKWMINSLRHWNEAFYKTLDECYLVCSRIISTFTSNRIITTWSVKYKVESWIDLIMLYQQNNLIMFSENKCSGNNKQNS